MYYLQSRYYNPEWGRFINADGYLGRPGELLEHNLFAYCKNNPVNMSDPSGQFAFLLLLVPEVIEVAAAIVTAVIIAAPAIINEVSMIISTYGPQLMGVVQNLADKVPDNGNSNNNSENSNSPNNNNNNKPNKSDYKKYEAKQMEKEYGLKKGEFHSLKKDILTEVRKEFPKEMKRVGDNPDIHLNSDGLMKIVSRTSKYSFDTTWDIKSFLPK